MHHRRVRAGGLEFRHPADDGLRRVPGLGVSVARQHVFAVGRRMIKAQRHHARPLLVIDPAGDPLIGPTGLAPGQAVERRRVIGVVVARVEIAVQRHRVLGLLGKDHAQGFVQDIAVRPLAHFAEPAGDHVIAGARMAVTQHHLGLGLDRPVLGPRRREGRNPALDLDVAEALGAFLSTELLEVRGQQVIVGRAVAVAMQRHRTLLFLGIDVTFDGHVFIAFLAVPQFLEIGGEDVVLLGPVPVTVKRHRALNPPREDGPGDAVADVAVTAVTQLRRIGGVQMVVGLGIEIAQQRHGIDAHDLGILARAVVGSRKMSQPDRLAVPALGDRQGARALVGEDVSGNAREIDFRRTIAVFLEVTGQDIGRLTAAVLDTAVQIQRHRAFGRLGEDLDVLVERQGHRVRRFHWRRQRWLFLGQVAGGSLETPGSTWITPQLVDVAGVEVIGVVAFVITEERHRVGDSPIVDVSRHPIEIEAALTAAESVGLGCVDMVLSLPRRAPETEQGHRAGCALGEDHPDLAVIGPAVAAVAELFRVRGMVILVGAALPIAHERDRRIIADRRLVGGFQGLGLPIERRIDHASLERVKGQPKIRMLVADAPASPQNDLSLVNCQTSTTAAVLAVGDNLPRGQEFHFQRPPRIARRQGDFTALRISIGPHAAALAILQPAVAEQSPCLVPFAVAAIGDEFLTIPVLGMANVGAPGLVPIGDGIMPHQDLVRNPASLQTVVPALTAPAVRRPGAIAQAQQLAVQRLQPLDDVARQIPDGADHRFGRVRHVPQPLLRHVDGLMCQLQDPPTTCHGILRRR